MIIIIIIYVYLYLKADDTNVQTKRKRNDDANKDTESGNLEKRIKELEDSTKQEAVSQLKQKVRSLCLQQEPCEPLILLTLDELSKMARKINSDDADTFEELARQANRHRGKIDIASLCLSILGGKAADAITKALTKCMKEKQIDTKVESASKVENQIKPFQSPLTNLYHNYGAPMIYPNSFPYQAPPYQGMMYNQQGFAQDRFIQRGRYRMQKQKGACLFCDSTDHFVKDCEKMKIAKRK